MPELATDRNRHFCSFEGFKPFKKDGTPKKGVIFAEWHDIAYEDFGKDTLFLGSNLFRNRYHCPCGEAWESEWDCLCNDKCQKCGKEIEPYQSQEIAGELP